MIILGPGELGGSHQFVHAFERILISKQADRCDDFCQAFLQAPVLFLQSERCFGSIYYFFIARIFFRLQFSILVFLWPMVPLTHLQKGTFVKIMSAKLFSKLRYSFSNQKDVLAQSIASLLPDFFLDSNFQFWSFCQPENQIQVIFRSHVFQYSIGCKNCHLHVLCNTNTHQMSYLS